MKYRAYTGTTEKDMKTVIEYRSYIHNLSCCEFKTLNRLELESNPWPLQYRCSALPTELYQANLESVTVVSSFRNIPVDGEE